VDGSTSMSLCTDYCKFNWDTAGKSAYISFPALHQGSYSIPVMHDGLPKTPPAGFARIEDIPGAKPDATIPWYVESAVSPLVYAYSRENTRRNLYRIQLP
jgi:hypothetical protein